MMAKPERCKHVKLSEGIDRISSLPKPLLSHILSLLPTKYAVATSILSTRWRFLWTSITSLNFDDKEVLRSYPKEFHITRRNKFDQFVSRVLFLLDQPRIQNFQLKCHQLPCEPFYLDLWICAAIRRTVQKLELHLVLAQPVELPISHFHYRNTLAVLKMNGDIHFNFFASPSICFPNLLTLHLSKTHLTIASNCSCSFPSLKDLLLDSLRYTNEESVHKLFASCSSLENLIIEISDRDNTLSLIISIPSLISLTIHFKLSPPEVDAFKLEIDTPALKYLFVEDGSMCCFTSKNLSSLLEARIQMDIFGLPTIDANSYGTNILKFIGGLSNAKFLSIAAHTLEAISSISANIEPVFYNLKWLELSRDSCGDWCVVLRNLLGRMLFLKHLVLNEGIYYYGYHKSESWWAEPLFVPSCLLYRVSTISLTGRICGCSDELELVRYFLKNAKVLKMLTVESIRGSEAEKCELMQKILTSPRGSQKCQVEFGVKGANGYEHPCPAQKKGA